LAAEAVQYGWDRVGFARDVLMAEADALRWVAHRLGDSFLQIVDVLAACTGRVGLTGVGKSADVAQKIVGTLNSTGTRSYSLDATRAMHGDLGAVHSDDVVVLLSHRGESEELLRLLPSLKSLAGTLIAVTSTMNSTLSRQCHYTLAYGEVTEACPNSLAPSSSTTVMMALGDALAFTLSEQRNFRAPDFARYHPAGSLGKQLASVNLYMRNGSELRLASAESTLREVFATARNRGRRTGAVILTEADGTLAGLFTDSDLARLFEKRADDSFDQPIRNVMTKNPTTIAEDAKMGEAMEMMKLRKFSELPVVDKMNRPVGLLDITDLFALETEADSAEPTVLRLVGGQAT
jgi:arabinose-5-phosphate isomerase